MIKPFPNKFIPPSPNPMGLSMIVTKIELSQNHPNHYRVTFNKMWKLINTYKQIEESAHNWDEIEHVLIPIERKRKINKILDTENKIYRDIVLFEKNNYSQ